MHGDVCVPFAMVTDLGGAGPLKVTIGSLPDEVLIEIFELYMNREGMEECIRLAHACQGW